MAPSSVVSVFLLMGGAIQAAELTVGPGKTYAKPSLAAAAANHGDTISIDAGTYLNDVCTWTKDNLTIRGVTRPVTLRVKYFGQWSTPWWENGVDLGPKLRAGFLAETTINRHDFGVSWNANLDGGGLVVGNEVLITIDAEAVYQG